MAKNQSIPPGQVGPIILVDDEVELVLAVSAMLKAELGEARVRATSDANEALAWMKREKPAVLITDVRMPGLSGLELISHVQETWGPTPTVVITAFPTEAVSVGARRGSFVYLPKPFSFRSLVETVQQLEQAPPASFSGAIAVSTLADLLQLYAISGSTGMMAVRSGERRGEIWFERGQVTHARSGESEGFDAFCAILAWPKGSFSWQTRRSERQTISMSVSELMLEAYRIHDEATRDAPLAAPSTPPPPPSSRPGASSAPPSSSSLAQQGARVTPGGVSVVLPLLQRLDGFLGAAVVDSESGTTLGSLGSGLDLAIATAGNTEVVRAKRKTMRDLELRDDIEDILITLGKQYHLIRPLRAKPTVFFYMALDRAKANLAMARLRLADAERELVL